MTVFKRRSLKGLLLAATILAIPLIATTPAVAQVEIGISVQLAPPMLPVYEQPAMPDLGYIWTPGYWSWAGPVGYYWVPGTWVLPPSIGVLWTPPYWGWSNGVYVFNAGYWGPHVGFYGGVNYGFGYGGNGYEGGRWNDGQFAYNRTVNNFGAVHVTNVYEKNVTVINDNHVSFVGGTGGLRSVPSAEDRAAANEHHVAPTTEQTAHIAAAAREPTLAASRNNGHPAIAATSQPAKFEGPGVVHAAPAGVGEHAAAPAVAAHPAQPTPLHPVATNAATPHPAAVHAPPPPRTAQVAPAHPAAVQPVAAKAAAPRPVAARPAPTQHTAQATPAPHQAAVRPVAVAAAPHPAAAHVAPAQQGKEKKPAT